MLGVVWLSQRINNRCTNRSNNKNNNTNRSSHNLKYHRGRQNQQEHTWNIWKVIFLFRIWKNILFSVVVIADTDVASWISFIFIFFCAIPPELRIFVWPVSHILSITFVCACFNISIYFPYCYRYICRNFEQFSQFFTRSIIQSVCLMMTVFHYTATQFEFDFIMKRFFFNNATIVCIWLKSLFAKNVKVMTWIEGGSKFFVPKPILSMLVLHLVEQVVLY